MWAPPHHARPLAPAGRISPGRSGSWEVSGASAAETKGLGAGFANVPSAPPFPVSGQTGPGGRVPRPCPPRRGCTGRPRDHVPGRGAREHGAGQTASLTFTAVGAAPVAIMLERGAAASPGARSGADSGAGRGAPDRAGRRPGGDSSPTSSSPGQLDWLLAGARPATPLLSSSFPRPAPSADLSGPPWLALFQSPVITNGSR